MASANILRSSEGPQHPDFLQWRFWDAHDVNMSPSEDAEAGACATSSFSKVSRTINKNISVSGRRVSFWLCSLAEEKRMMRVWAVCEEAVAAGGLADQRLMVRRILKLIYSLENGKHSRTKVQGCLRVCNVAAGLCHSFISLCVSRWDLFFPSCLHLCQTFRDVFVFFTLHSERHANSTWKCGWFRVA